MRKFSGGMIQRVGIAQAMLNDPKILILDEPTAGLDPISSTLIEDYIVRLKDETNAASVVVTHQMSTIKRTADKVIMLYEGKVVLKEPPNKCLNRTTTTQGSLLRLRLKDQ